MREFSHINSKGQAKMVDVSPKNDTVRIAVANGSVRMKSDTLEKIKQNQIMKGDVLSVARVAAIMAAKKTADLIPLCHPITIDNVCVDFNFVDGKVIKIKTEAKSSGKTGVEMEALVAASVAALTIYDMCKAVDRGMTIDDIYLESKKGGKSGTYTRGRE
ncbi:MAG: cyclic pyranopterin monophosphate synthase MoaC [Dehalococcoidia bacterium]|nr:MAG: cyclic pyranopterin monophosphate synthase MoaC [Dehalococcoidia bacterium]